MSRKLVGLLLVAFLLGGCYFGRSRSGKATAVVVNGAVAATGVLVITGDSSKSCESIECGAGAGAEAGARMLVGGVLVRSSGWWWRRR